jgi:hypothetical protein
MPTHGHDIICVSQQYGALSRNVHSDAPGSDIHQLWRIQKCHLNMPNKACH